MKNGVVRFDAKQGGGYGVLIGTTTRPRVCIMGDHGPRLILPEKVLPLYKRRNTLRSAQKFAAHNTEKEGQA